jgi:serine protease Do
MPRRPVSTLATALLILATATIPSPGVADSPPAAAADPAIERVLAKVFPALVRIDVVMVEGEDGRLNKRQGAGSGVVITPAGHVVTNHHVAGRARHLVCRMPDGEEIDATLVGTDPLADIAVIKLDLASRRAGARPLAVAAFGDSDRVRVGDRVFALGSPAAVSQSVTSGIVSNTSMVLPELFWFMRMKLDGEDVGELVRWIAHDAVIFGGNSGGPLVNAAGEIVGINEIGLASLGGAVPGNLAKSVADQLIATGRVTRSWIGLEAQPLLKGSREPRGVLVAGVIQGSPADAAGIRAGDIVVSVNGQAVNCPIPDDLPLFNAVLLGLPVGKPATLVIRPAATPTTAPPSRSATRSVACSWSGWNRRAGPAWRNSPSTTSSCPSTARPRPTSPPPESCSQPRRRRSGGGWCSSSGAASTACFSNASPPGTHVRTTDSLPASFRPLPQPADTLPLQKGNR